MGWWMGVGYWENLEEGEEEEEDEGQKEGKKKSRGSIDRFLAYSFLFLFLSPFSFDVFPIFFPREEKTITHHSASRSHLASKHISFSLPPPQGILRTSNSRNRNIFLLLLLGAREREREGGGSHEE